MTTTQTVQAWNEARLHNPTENIDLRDADLDGANLSGVNLTRANLTRATLRSTDLRGANLRCADLRWSALWFANLTGATLRSTDLRGANLCRANLSGVDLYGANLSGVDLSDANLTETGCVYWYTEHYHISVTPDFVHIGCYRSTHEEWLKRQKNHAWKIAASVEDRGDAYLRDQLSRILAVMQDCKEKGWPKR